MTLMKYNSQNRSIVFLITTGTIQDDEDDYRLDRSKASEPELYYAHTDFSDTVGDCLSFKRGDILEIHDKNQSGWWFGRRMKGDQMLSWIPANYLQKVFEKYSCSISLFCFCLSRNQL